MLKRTISHRYSEGELTDADGVLTPLLKRIYENRNITDITELDYRLDQLSPPHTLKDGMRAVEILVACLQQDKKILIIGDYDADGATAATLGSLVLREMGCQYVEYLVPNRFDYGYGLSEEIAEVAISMSPDVVITVDNGISSVAGVKLLRQHDIQVIVTDHHLPSDVLPDANAIVNPNQQGCDFPSKALAGVGVMFYLLLLLREKLVGQQWFKEHGREKPNLAKYLDLVALGTVADMVPLDRNNRILVHQGLLRIRAGKCRFGILALFQVANRQYQMATAADIGFAIAPRINAAGRLEDISMGIECLLSDNQQSAMHYATLLNDINMQRRQIEKEMQDNALDIMSKLALPEKLSVSGYCLFDDSFHQGITGLVASKIKEKIQQPVIVFAKTKDGTLSGSGRSVNNIHLKDLLDSIANDNPALLKKYGGHAMAVGMTIEASQFDVFQSVFYRKVENMLLDSHSFAEIASDGELSSDEISLDQAEAIHFEGPWGNCFPEPLFDGVFYVESQKLIGGAHLKMQLRYPKQAALFDAIAFNFVEQGQAVIQFACIKIVYRLGVNVFRGNRKLQLTIEYLEEVNA